MFFYFDLEKNSSSPGGAVFYRPDLPGSGLDLDFDTFCPKKTGAVFDFLPDLKSDIDFDRYRDWL